MQRTRRLTCGPRLSVPPCPLTTRGRAMTDLTRFKERAGALGAITHYEADSAGRVYAVYENGEVLPISVTLPSLAGRSNIPQGGFDQAVAVWDAGQSE